MRAPSDIFHLYNSTSTLQRRVGLWKSRQEIIDLALEGVELVKREVAHPETRLSSSIPGETERNSILP